MYKHLSETLKQTAIYRSFFINLGEDTDDGDDDAPAFCTTLLSFRSKPEVYSLALTEI
jgi:hypothetical protein